MSASAALRKKPSDQGDATHKTGRQATDPQAEVGVPAFLGGVAGGGGTPAFLQRAPVDGTPEIEDEEALPDGSIQRLPQDPFPDAVDDEEQDDAAAAIQAKLQINTPGDAYEKEADRVADAVTSGGQSGPVSNTSGAPSVQRKCASCGGESEDGGTCPACAAKVQRKEGGGSTPRPTASVAQAVAKPGSGQPIPDGTRGPIEQELGQDLGHVRVHQDSDAADAASSIGAKAFTHQNHIWLGPGQSADDTALMAHEATHTVQQAGGSSGPALVQRAPADHQHPEDGSAPKARMDAEIANVDEDDGGDWEEGDPVPQVDQSAKQSKAGPLVSKAKPDTDRPAQEGPKVEQAANEVKQEADSPTEDMVDGQSEQPDAEGAETEEPPAAADPIGDAMAQISSLPEPEAPQPIEAPPIAQPVDGDGQPLPPEAQNEAMVQAVAAQLQVSREAAYALRRKAKQQRANAILLRGNLALADQHIAESEAGLTTSHGHMEVRREALAEADNAHATSEQKADTVAQEAPGIEAEAGEAEGESGPMASEASDSASQAQANTPDDPEAAEKSGETSGQMGSVAGDSASMDQAASATKQRAVQLQADAAQAKEKNTTAKAAIEGAKGSADQIDAKLVEMDGQTAQARGELEPLTGTPDAAEAEAQRLDDAAAVADQRVETMAGQLRDAQSQFVADMGRVPGSETLAEENEGQIQRTEDPAAPAAGSGEAPQAFAPRGYEGRRKVELPTFQMGPPLTEEQRQQQAEAAARAEERRRARIRAIQDGAYGNFDEMDGLDKAGLALDFMMQDAFASASNIKWPDWSAGSVGKALLNIIDPRGPLNGIIGGLSMIASGGLNLFDMDQWSRDPLGNLLKSAADIATGITVILGSIVALLGVVTAISAAIAVLMFWVPPVAAAAASVMTWCASAGITVGGWTISVGLLALYFQGLLIIKNIVDVMTAETAEDLVQNTEQLSDDFSQTGNIAMQMGTAYLGAKGGPGMIDDIATNGVRTVARQEVVQGLQDAAIEVVAGEDISGVVGVARMAHGAHAHATSGGGGGGDAPRADDGSAPRPADADTSTPAPDAGGGDVRPDADASTPAPPREDAGPPPSDAPTQDAPTPNNQLPATEGPSPNLVEGDTPAPSRDMDTAPPEPPQPQSDATSDADASARTDEPGADQPPAGGEPTIDGGGSVERPDTSPQVPKADADAEGGSRQQGDADAPRPDGDGPNQRGSEDGGATLRPDAEGDGARPQDSADPNAPRPDSENPTALREAAASKPLADLSPAERRAEADQANSGPSRDIGDPRLEDIGFDSRTSLDNGKDYIRSEEQGVVCRVANMSCEVGDPNPPDPNTPTPAVNPDGGEPQPKVAEKVAAATDGEGGDSGAQQKPPGTDPEAPQKDGADDASPQRDQAEPEADQPTLEPAPETTETPDTPVPKQEEAAPDSQQQPPATDPDAPQQDGTDGTSPQRDQAEPEVEQPTPETTPETTDKPEPAQDGTDTEGQRPQTETDGAEGATQPRNDEAPDTEGADDSTKPDTGTDPEADPEVAAAARNAENKLEVADKYEAKVGEEVTPELEQQLKEDGYSVRRENGVVTQILRRKKGAKDKLPVISVEGGEISEVSLNERSQSRRDEYAGGTPDKYSKTGGEVLDRMREEGLIHGEGDLTRGNPNGLELELPDGTRMLIGKDVDMGHIEAAVDFWNRAGYKYGPKSEVMRKFMLRSDNYRFESKHDNRSEGASMDANYRKPKDPPDPIPDSWDWDTL
ncbi:eCIS core domain-containing protein [Parerythrobacter aestuarii]|uniref:eCIS core domain-containing protein n=1 Tax=Parerythrobacter aestuarii TaxID=3020909 RepID=UPI0024DE889C|nr:DUF4157 domain-containing protein [Parerythrobacter aestuarii]